MRKRLIGVFWAIFILGLSGCQEYVAERSWGDRTINCFEISGLVEYCIDENGEYLYCTKEGSSSLFQYTVQGDFVTEISIIADEKEPITGGSIEELESGIGNLSGLCISGNILYCYRSLKNTLISVNLEEGTSCLLGKMNDTGTMREMAAGDNTLLLHRWNEVGKEELWVWELNTGEAKRVPIEGNFIMTHKVADNYWLTGYDEEAGCYYLQVYDAITEVFSDKYTTNLINKLCNMVYIEEENAIYGYVEGLGQYIRLIPEQANSITRFQAQHTYDDMVKLQKRGEKIYLQDRTLGKIYYFNSSAYIADNTPLKGYVLDIATVQDYAGYNVALEVLPWEELALKVLAGDADYDFVILKTEMPEAMALRNALAFEPISLEYIKEYWQECQPCIKEAALYDDEVWMLPLNLSIESIVYNKENMERMGIDMEQVKTLPEWYEVAKQLYNAGYEDYYSLNYPVKTVLYAYIYDMLHKEEINFDTEEFKGILRFLTGENGITADFWHLYLGISWMNYSGDWEDARIALYKDIFMECGGIITAYELYQGQESLHVRSIPPMPGTEELVQVSGDILILNPNAPNKEDVLAFVRDLSQLVIEKPENWLSANRERYPSDPFMEEVLSLYGKGKIIFGFPEELFTQYYIYIYGEEMEEQTVIDELNRTLKMYLRE